MILHARVGHSRTVCHKNTINLSHDTFINLTTRGSLEHNKLKPFGIFQNYSDQEERKEGKDA